MSDDKADELIKAVNRLADLLESVIAKDRFDQEYIRMAFP